MLVVRVEVWPGGNEARAKEIARVGIANVSPGSEYSDYEVAAILAAKGEETILRTEICHHERAQGWMPLVRRVLTNLFLRSELARPAAYGDPMVDLLRKDRDDKGR